MINYIKLVLSTCVVAVFSLALSGCANMFSKGEITFENADRKLTIRDAGKYNFISGENIVLSELTTNRFVSPTQMDACTTACAGGTMFCICEDENGNGFSYACGSCPTGESSLIQHRVGGKIVLSIPLPKEDLVRPEMKISEVDLEN